MAEGIRGKAPDAHTRPFEYVRCYSGKLCDDCDSISLFSSADVHSYACHTY